MTGAGPPRPRCRGSLPTGAEQRRRPRRELPSRCLAAIPLICLASVFAVRNAPAQHPEREAAAVYRQFEQTVMGADCLSIRVAARLKDQSEGFLKLDYSVALRLKRGVGIRAELSVRGKEEGSNRHWVAYGLGGKTHHLNLVTGKEEPADLGRDAARDDDKLRLLIARLGFLSWVVPMPDHQGPGELRDVLRLSGIEFPPRRLEQAPRTGRIRFTMSLGHQPLLEESLTLDMVTARPLQRELVGVKGTQWCATEIYNEFTTTPFPDDLLAIEAAELTGPEGAGAGVPAKATGSDTRGRR